MRHAPISCGPSCLRTHKTAPPSRLHARGRPHARETLGARRPVADLLGPTEGNYQFVDGQEDCRL